VFSTIEPGLGIVAGSMCTLRPLLRHVRRRLKERKNPNYSSSGPASAEVSSHRRRKDIEKGDDTLQGSTTLALTTVDSTKSKGGMGPSFLLSTIDQARTFQDEATRTVDRDPHNVIEEEDEGADGNEPHPQLKREPDIESQDITDVKRKAIDEETSQSIRSKRATWWPMTRTSITQMNQLSSVSSVPIRHDPEDFRWLDLKEEDNKEFNS
jgi:hypothetical protein